MTARWLEVQLAGLGLRNPVLAASGTYGSGIEASGDADLAGIGGVVTKSVTSRPRRGNPPPRIYETHGGMLNSIGIQNPGVEGFLKHVMPRFADLPCARIVNVAGESEEDFRRLVEAFDGVRGVDALELNVSCPNVAGGLDYGADPDLLEPLVAACRQCTEKPLLVKLTPNVTDIALTARAAERGGADVVTLVNTYLGMAVDWRRRRPHLGSPTGTGGLSGPAIKPMALHAVHRAAGAVRLPLVGIGGICCAEDVMEFIVAGAAAVQVGTANFLDPRAPVRIARDLQELVTGEVAGPLQDLVGSLRIPGREGP